MTRKAAVVRMCAAAFCLTFFSLLFLPSSLAWGSSPAKSPMKAMKTVVNKPLIKGTLKQAIRQCEKLAGVQIVVEWPILKDTGVGQDRRVFIKAPKATVEQLLEMILVQAASKGHPLAWYADGGRIRVTSQRRLLYDNRLSAARASRREPAGSAKPAKSGRPRKGLLREINFNNIKLVNVIGFFRNVSGVNFHVNWRSLKTVGLTRQTAVTLKVKNITIAKALDILLDDISGNGDKFSRVYWVVDGGVVRIATGTALNQRLHTRVFNIQDMLMIAPDFRGPRINFNVSAPNRSANGNGSSNNESLFQDEDNNNNKNSGIETRAERRKRLRTNIIGAIKDSIGPDMWQPQGKGAIRIMRGKLIISQTLLGFKLMEQASK